MPKLTSTKDILDGKPIEVSFKDPLHKKREPVTDIKGLIKHESTEPAEETEPEPVDITATPPLVAGTKTPKHPNGVPSITAERLVELVGKFETSKQSKKDRQAAARKKHRERLAEGKVETRGRGRPVGSKDAVPRKQRPDKQRGGGRPVGSVKSTSTTQTATHAQTTTQLAAQRKNNRELAKQTIALRNEGLSDAEALEKLTGEEDET